MSRFYEMSVEISEYDPAKAKEIQAAAEAEWSFDDWWCWHRRTGRDDARLRTGQPERR